MNPRHLTIIIIVLYTLAALSLLGMGNARQKLEHYQAMEQSNLKQDSTYDHPDAEGVVTATEKQELQDGLTRWQIIAVSFFAAASLLLVLKDKLVKKKPEVSE